MAQTFSFPNYGLFNATYYLQQNPDVATSWTGTPLQHYIQFGALEGRAPTAWFNADFYRASYTDLQSMNALQLFNHYCNYGFNEGRVPMLNFSNFNGARYLLDNPDVDAAGYTAADAISHYVVYGEYEGRTAYAQNGVVINPVVNLGDTYTLTTGVDNYLGTQFNDTFNAALGGANSNTNTLNGFDSLDGQGGTDTIYATLATSVTPSNMANIEIFNVDTAVAGGTTTLNMLNAGQATQVNNVGSTGTTTLAFTNIAAGAALSVQDTATSTTFGYATTAGTQTAGLTLSSVTGGTETIAGIETINITSSGSANTATLTAADAATVTIAGSTDLTLNTTGSVSATKWDASSATGNVGLTVVAPTNVAATTDISVLGGSGNDTLTLSAVTAQDVSVNAGAGNDTIVDTAVTATDSIDGGTGTADTLSTLNAAAVALAGAAQTTFTNLEQLTISDGFNDGGAAFNLTNIGSSFNTLNLANADGGATDITDGAESVTGAAGTLTVNLGGALAANVAQVNGTLTFTDTGTATTDSLVINNLAVNSTGNVNYNIFHANTYDIVSAGYENVTLNTGAAVGVGIIQDMQDILITADSTSANTSVTLTGTNAIDIEDINVNAAASTGKLTVDASGLTAQADGVITLNIADVSLAATGTISITGSAGRDTITVGNSASTVVAGAGRDSITGGTAADSIDGGEGNDTLKGSGGNDTILGGAGLDTISAIVAGDVSIDGGAANDNIALGTTLSTADTISGGEGYDTVDLANTTAGGAVAAAAGARLSSIEAISFSGAGALAQSMAVFSNTTVDTVIDSRASATALAITNAGSSLNTFAINTGSAVTDSFARATDTTSDALTIRADAAVVANASLTASNEETVTIAAQTFAVDLDLLTMTDLATLNVTGSGAGAIVIDAQAATALAAINASGLTGTHTLNVDATDSTTALTFTGGAYTGNTTISAGTGNDVITAGTGALYANGNGGNDSLTGGAGADSLSGGIGADTLVGGVGTDSLLGGVGIDTFQVNGANVVQDLGQNNQADILVVASGATATTAVTGNWTATAASQNNAATAAGAALTMGATVTTVNLDAVTGTTGWSVTGGTGATGVTGSDYADTISVAASTGDVTVTGGAGADAMTAAAGVATINTVFNYVVAGVTIPDQTGVSTIASLDSITGFVSSAVVGEGDKLKLGTAGDATANTGNYVEVADATYADYAAILAAGNTALATLAATTSSSTQIYAFVGDDTGTDNGYLFIDTDLNGVADAAIQLVGVLQAGFAATDIIA